MNDLFTSITADSFFVSSAQLQESRRQMAGNALNTGITAYQKGDYKSAITAFRNAIGLDPQAQNAVDIGNYVASSYLKLGDNRNATKAYEEAIDLDKSRDDTHIKLGDLYFSEERY